MSTKNISLDEEAYKKLKKHKKEGESFSDVIKKLAGEHSLDEVAGILTEKQGKQLEEAIEQGRERSRQRQEELYD